MSQNDEKDGNVVNLAEMRKKQRTTHRKGASGKGKSSSKWGGQKGQQQGYNGSGGYQGQGSGPKNKFFIAIQFVVFMFALWFLMQQCRH